MNRIRRPEFLLFMTGLGLLGFSVWLSLLSKQFDIAVSHEDRPVKLFVAAMIIASVGWLVACWLAYFVRSESRKSILFWIVGIGFASRIVLTFSTPILEIDLYRYLWDGNVTVHTGDPFKYAPIEFEPWRYRSAYPFTRSDEELEQLDGFRSLQDDSMKETLGIVAWHYGQFTSPYPPVSQSVFALSHLCCPEDSSLKTRVVVLKAWLVLFDIATGIVLIMILRQLKLPTTMSIVWFWAPLVLKEFANGGHLDSIAIFCTTMFAWFAIKQLGDPKRSFRWSLGAGVFLALAVGAKIYPIVLAPLWAVATIRKLNLSGMAAGIVSISLIFALLMPMLDKVHEYRSSETGSMPMPGILAFAESWEMNDFLFMVVVENLKPAVANESGELQSPWVVVVPNNWRSEMDFQNAFSTAKQITTLVFLGIVMWQLWCWWKSDEVDRQRFFIEFVFLTLTWFWLLSPTQNPWYLCWAMPFLACARSRIWFLLAVTTPLYYVRFWFDYQGHDIAGFDFFVPVIEFAPVLLLLTVVSLRKRLGKLRTSSQNGSPAKR